MQSYESAVKVNDRKLAHFDIDPVAEKQLLRKLDLRVVSVLWVLFLLAVLDRTDIGNARIQGMTTELNRQGDDFNVALFIFFVPYMYPLRSAE